MEHKEVTTGEIMEVLDFIKDHMVMKADLAAIFHGEDVILKTYGT